MSSCMATKTITLEIDAYEKLKAAKRSDRESFSSVVRRGRFDSGSGTGESILATLRELAAENLLAPETSLDYLESARGQDTAAPRVSVSKWETNG